MELPHEATAVCEHALHLVEEALVHRHAHLQAVQGERLESCWCAPRAVIERHARTEARLGVGY